MMHWFGPRPFGPVCDTNPQIASPIGGPCSWCEEAIEPQDNGLIYLYEPIVIFHIECMLRQVLGGFNHHIGVCTCCGGSQPPDPSHLSRRQAARLVAERAHWSD